MTTFLPPPRILIVDDDDNVIRMLRREIEKIIPEAEIISELNFDQGKKLISDQRFDMVVLDWMEGDNPQDDTGLGIWQQMWQSRLVPIIIFTARDSVAFDPPIPTDHPLLHYMIKRGTGGPQLVAERLSEMRETAMSLRSVDDEIGKVFRDVVGSSVVAIWEHGESEQDRRTMLIRSVRRRIAAMMDLYPSGERLHSSEQYIYPPIGESLLTGDILIKTGSDHTDAESFYVVLSPSCDLEMRGGSCAIDEILVARCEPIKQWCNKISIGNPPSSGQDKRLGKLVTALSQPQAGGLMPMPSFGSRIPHMAVNLKRLVLLPMTEIDVTGNGKKYHRIASVDSPFREQVTWGYMLVAGRPGMPNRDFDEWAQKIVELIDNSTLTSA